MRHWQDQPQTEVHEGGQGAGPQAHSGTGEKSSPDTALRWPGSSRWKDKRIIFVSGKGGVGKSLLAAAIAAEQTRAGRKVLLAEIGDKSYYQDYWNLPVVRHEPVRLTQGFDLALWSGESCLREYVLFYLKMARLYRLFFENKVMRALVNVAPGLNEIAILGKITSGLRRVGPPMNYDLVVVDAYATGHAMALFHSPKGLMEAIRFGPMGHHSQAMLEVLENPSFCAYEIVTLLEEMPVVETLEFREQLHKEVGIWAGIIGNKVMKIPESEAELQRQTENRDPGLAEFAKYLRSLAKRQATFSAQLNTVTEKPVMVPLIFSADPDVLVDDVAEVLRTT